MARTYKFLEKLRGCGQSDGRSARGRQCKQFQEEGTGTMISSCRMNHLQTQGFRTIVMRFAYESVMSVLCGASWVMSWELEDLLPDGSLPWLRAPLGLWVGASDPFHGCLGFLAAWYPNGKSECPRRIRLKEHHSFVT